MIIPDTSIWIEYLKGKEPLHSELQKAIERNSVIALPWIFGEILQGARDKEEISIIDSYWHALNKPPHELCTECWIAAGKESQKGKLHKRGIGLIDLAILSVAVSFKCKLWTLDKNLAALAKFRGIEF